MFLIGEFSKISRVSKRSLHYYDEIGLLKPVHIDLQTGYRYYSARQLPRLNRILALKALGLTLDQIARMLAAEVSDEEIHGMLLMKKAELEQSLLEGLQRLRSIEARLQQNLTLDDGLDVVLKSVPAQPFLSTRTILPSLEEGKQLVWQLQHVLPSKVDPRAIGSLTVVHYSDGFSDTDVDCELGFLLKGPTQDEVSLSENHILRVHTLPAVATMATLVQAGDPNLIAIAYGTIGQWLEANEYRLAGPHREIVFELPTSGRVDEMIVEVQLPVEKIDPSPDWLVNSHD